jgi:hypothetical protein
MFPACPLVVFACSVAVRLLVAISTVPIFAASQFPAVSGQFEMKIFLLVGLKNPFTWGPKQMFVMRVR